VIPYQSSSEIIAATPPTAWAHPITPPEPAALDDDEPPHWGGVVAIDNLSAETSQPEVTRLVLRLLQTGDDRADAERLRQVLTTLRDHPGPTPVRLGILNGGGPVWLDTGLTVEVNGRLERRLLGLLQRLG
jgi:hypothetical protein